MEWRSGWKKKHINKTRDRRGGLIGRIQRGGRPVFSSELHPACAFPRKNTYFQTLRDKSDRLFGRHCDVMCVYSGSRRPCMAEKQKAYIRVHEERTITTYTVSPHHYFYFTRPNLWWDVCGPVFRLGVFFFLPFTFCDGRKQDGPYMHSQTEGTRNQLSTNPDSSCLLVAAVTILFQPRRLEAAEE